MPSVLPRAVPHRDNDITGVLDQSFAVEEEEFGQVVTHDLCENGRNIPVTEENKKRYVKCVPWCWGGKGGRAVVSHKAPRGWGDAHRQPRDQLPHREACREAAQGVQDGPV